MVTVQDLLARIDQLPFTEDQKRAVRVALPTLDVSVFNSQDDFDIIEYLNGTLDLQRPKPTIKGQFAIYIDPNPVTRWGFAYFDCTAIRVQTGAILGHAELSFSQVSEVANQIYELSNKQDLPDVPSRIRWPLSHLTKSREERRHWMWQLLTELFNSPIPNDERFRSAQLLRDLIDDPVTQLHKDVYSSVRRAMKGQSHRGRQNRSLQVVLSTPGVSNMAAIGIFADTGDGELTLFRKFTDLTEEAFDDILTAVYRHMEDFEYYATAPRDTISWENSKGRGTLITFRRSGAFKIKEAAHFLEDKVRKTGKAMQGAVEQTRELVDAAQGSPGAGAAASGVTVTEVTSDQDGTAALTGPPGAGSNPSAITTTTTTTAAAGAGAGASTPSAGAGGGSIAANLAMSVAKTVVQNEEVRNAGASLAQELVANPQVQAVAQQAAGQIAGHVTEEVIDRAIDTGKQHVKTAAVAAVKSQI